MSLRTARCRLIRSPSAGTLLKSFVRSTNPIRHLLGNHENWYVRVGSHEGWHNGSVNDAQVFHAHDTAIRVVGMENLRVVDASIMPTLVRANTHVPVLMIAEKMADRIRATHK